MAELKWGDFRRTRPISDFWGLDRGRPVDRFYIESFLAEMQADIAGRVLEVENPGYSIRFGAGKITQLDVLDIDPGNGKATIIADLSNGVGIPRETYDCFVLTQTLQLIFDLKGAIASTFQLLKPGGVVLATVPGITPVPKRDSASKAWCWSFTGHSVARLFGEVFGVDNLQVQTYGNVLSASAFLWGLSQSDLTVEELAFADTDYQVIIAVRAVKPISIVPSDPSP